MPKELPASLAALVIAVPGSVLADGGNALPSIAMLSLRTGLALGAVLAAIAGLAYLLRRFGSVGGARTENRRLGAIARLDLGGRREIRIVRAAGRTLVVGVTPQRIDLLIEIPGDPSAETVPELRVIAQ